MTDSAHTAAEELIAEAVSHFGLLRVITSAIAAWWRQPRLPQDLPDQVRADLGELGRTEIHYPSSAPDIRLHYR